YIAFNSEAGGINFSEPPFYSPVPFLFLAAIRFCMLGATRAIAGIAFFFVDAALRGLGPFFEQSPARTAVALQNFLLLRAAPLYPVAVLIDQKQGVEHSLHERVKELTALHSAARILQNEQQTTAEWLQHFVGVLPPAWQYPEITAARIQLGEVEFANAEFQANSLDPARGFFRGRGTAGNHRSCLPGGETGGAGGTFDRRGAKSNRLSGRNVALGN